MKHKSPNPASHNPSAEHERLLVNAKVAARMLACSPRKLWQLTAEFEIPCTKIGNRNLYSPDALRAWIAANSRGGDS